MNTLNKKRAYSPPQIERIQLDNEISLTMESDPPTAPNERAQAPEYFNNDPFKANMC